MGQKMCRDPHPGSCHVTLFILFSIYRQDCVERVAMCIKHWPDKTMTVNLPDLILGRTLTPRHHFLTIYIIKANGGNA